MSPEACHTLCFLDSNPAPTTLAGEGPRPSDTLPDRQPLVFLHLGFSHRCAQGSSPGYQFLTGPPAPRAHEPNTHFLLVGMACLTSSSTSMCCILACSSFSLRCCVLQPIQTWHAPCPSPDVNCVVLWPNPAPPLLCHGS